MANTFKLPEQVKKIGTENPDVKDSGEFRPLSGKPFFDVVLTKSHVNGYCQLSLPKTLNPMLPTTPFCAAFVYGGKTWETIFTKRGKVDIYRGTWKLFVEDNNLKTGDACVFELEECVARSVKFKVQILKGDFPDELLEKDNGETSNTPIVLD